MEFATRKRRQPPAIIIVSLIDIMIVLLIFMMVTTTFKQQPALKLALPETRQKLQPGATDSRVIVTVAKQAPFFYLGDRPLTLDKLQEELAARAAQDPKTSLSIRADTDSPWGQIVKLMDVAKAAKITVANAYIKSAPAQ